MRPRQSWMKLARPLHAHGEHVDVEVVALELFEDVVELAHGVGVADLVGHCWFLRRGDRLDAAGDAPGRELGLDQRARDDRAGGAHGAPSASRVIE